jgi:GT2 family glycosyltransferase
MMVDISVIIVNWNTRQYVLDCIRSMLACRGNYGLEIIVVDNASQDNSILSIKENFPQVRIISNTENVGFARANNQGIEMAQGRYVALVNSDVLFLEDSLGLMLGYMDQNPEVGILGPKLLWQDQTLQGSCRKYPSIWNTLCPAIGLTGLFPKASFFSGEHMVGYFNHDRIQDVDALVGAFLLVRRSALQQIGGMDDQYFMYCEEVDWCKRFSSAGWKIRFFPDTKVIHYGGGSSAGEPVRFFREYCLSNLRYWNKHHSRLLVMAYRLSMITRYLVRLPLRTTLCWIKKNDETKTKLQTVLMGLQIFMTISKDIKVNVRSKTLK